MSAWSLLEHSVVWSTHIERGLNLLLTQPPEAGFGLACRELGVQNGVLAVPVAQARSISLAVGSGRVVGSRADNRAR